MSIKRFKLMAAVVLSVVLISTVLPDSAFADDGTKHIKVTVKNVNFDRDYLNNNGVSCSPEWTGVINYTVSVASNQAVGAAIHEKFGDNISYYQGYISGFFGLEAGIDVVTGSYDGYTYGCGGWLYTYNGNSTSHGIDDFLNGAADGINNVSIKDGDKFEFSYSLDGGVTNSPYIQTPHNVHAEKASYNSNKITWESYGNINDQWSNNTTDYIISRSTSKNGLYTKIATLNSTKKRMSYVDKSLKTGTVYYYKIKMVKGKNASDYSYIANAKPVLSRAKINVTGKGKRSLKIKWNKVEGANYYQIYRATAKNGKYKRIKTVSSKKTSYTNKNLKKGKRYYYKIRSYKKNDNKNIYSTYSTIKSKKI